MQPVQDLTVEDRVSRTQYQYTLEDPDPNELNLWTAQLVSKLKQLPELQDVATDQQTTGLAASLVIDRVTASRMGITPSMIDETLYDAFGQRQISTMYTQLNQYHVILETMPSVSEETQRVGRYLRSLRHRYDGASYNWNEHQYSVVASPLTSASSGAIRQFSQRECFIFSFGSGSAFPMLFPRSMAQLFLSSTFTHFESKTAPLSVNHQGQFPVVTISFNLAPNASLGQATKEIDKAQQEIGMPLSVQAAWQGTAASFQASLANEPILILAALVTVYIVLGVLYESYIHPITILSTLPSAGVGADSCPADLWPGTERRGAHRHHPVDRHR